MGQPGITKPPANRPTRAEWAEKLLKDATLIKPLGLGPFPLVIQLHGCGGQRPFMKTYSDAAMKAGYAVLIVDSFKPRGMSRLDGSVLVCTGLTLHGAERSADLYAVFDWARRQAWVDQRRIVAAGWSHGAWTIMDALALRERAPRFARLADLPADPLAGLAATVLVYPYAAFPSMTYSRGWGGAKPKVHALLCGKDQVVGTRYPQRAIDRLEKDGLKIDRLLFADGTHAFDDEKASDPRTRFRADYLQQAADWYGRALRGV